MNKTIQTILLVLLFIVCAALGYYLVGSLGGKRTAVPENEEKEMAGQEEPVREQASSAAGALRISEIDTPSYQTNTGVYLFRAHADGNGIVFHLTDNNKVVLNEYDQRTTDAIFEVPPTKSGNYYVFVEDASGQRSEYYLVSGCVPKQVASVKKMEQAELASLFNNKDSNAARTALNGRVAPNCKLSCTGLNEDEPAPASLYEVINRLKRSWESVNITNISYDSQGRISSVSLDVKQKQQ